MSRTYAKRRSVALLITLLVVAVGLLQNPDMYQTQPVDAPQYEQPADHTTAVSVLETLHVKGRAAKTDYARKQFGDGWDSVAGCDMRNQILRRDFSLTVVNAECKVVSGVLVDPYTGKTIHFQRGSISSQAVQIDHVVALSDAWQKGAQNLTYVERVKLSNDPLNLLAVDGDANQQKSNSDAASWLPPNKPFRCQYVARQIAVKQKYSLWVTSAEKDAMRRVLSSCPHQSLPTGSTSGAAASEAV
jgi:hypothetical protein